MHDINEQMCKPQIDIKKKIMTLNQKKKTSSHAQSAYEEASIFFFFFFFAERGYYYFNAIRYKIEIGCRYIVR